MIETNPSDCSTQSQVITLRVKGKSPGIMIVIFILTL